MKRIQDRRIISDLSKKMVLLAGPRQVGSPVSYQSLARDAAVSHGTVKRYVEILEALFIVFRVTPYSKNIARSLLKEPKIYFFDTGLA